MKREIVGWAIYIEREREREAYFFLDSEGIDVCKENGEVIGKSPKAGLKVVGQVAVSRVATAVPVMLFPPLAMIFLQRFRMFQSTS
jgi:hypothetical protein